MSLIERAYARLSESERARWTRAANVAQDGRHTDVERALAYDVTHLLIQVSRAREVLSIEVPVPEADLTPETDENGAGPEAAVARSPAVRLRPDDRRGDAADLT